MAILCGAKALVETHSLTQIQLLGASMLISCNLRFTNSTPALVCFSGLVLSARHLRPLLANLRTSVHPTGTG